MAGASAALATFEIENGISATDTIYKYDSAQNQRHLAGKPWLKDPRYFKHVKISALALVKMVMHARGGGSLEVMGLMLGKIDPDDARGPTMIVMDVFALPVEGTETRVNAQADAYEYMVEKTKTIAQPGAPSEKKPSVVPTAGPIAVMSVTSIEVAYFPALTRLEPAPFRHPPFM